MNGRRRLLVFVSLALFAANMRAQTAPGTFRETIGNEWVNAYFDLKTAVMDARRDLRDYQFNPTERNRRDALDTLARLSKTAKAVAVELESKTPGELLRLRRTDSIALQESVGPPSLTPLETSGTGRPHGAQHEEDHDGGASWTEPPFLCQRRPRTTGAFYAS